MRFRIIKYVPLSPFIVVNAFVFHKVGYRFGYTYHTEQNFPYPASVVICRCPHRHRRGVEQSFPLRVFLILNNYIMQYNADSYYSHEFFLLLELYWITYNYEAKLQHSECSFHILSLSFLIFCKQFPLTSLWSRDCFDECWRFVIYHLLNSTPWCNWFY